MASDLVFAKGAFSVTVHTIEVADEFNNQTFVIKPVQSTKNQADGSKSAKVVDLLRVTHQIAIRGYIVSTTSTALTIKRNLINIWKGAGTSGGEVTLTYDQAGSAFGSTSDTSTSTLSGYIEKIIFKDVPFDQPSDFESSPSSYTDVVRYEVSITFIEGVEV